LALQQLLQGIGIYSGNRYMSSYPENQQHKQGEKQFASQIPNLKGFLK
jgi:hypothetical protein